MPENFQGKGLSRVDPKQVQAEIVQRVGGAISRINRVTAHWTAGNYTSFYLNPRGQQDGRTCFFAGPLAIGEQFRGKHPNESDMASEAVRLKLLDQAGALTRASVDEPHRPQKMKQFLYDWTGVAAYDTLPQMPPELNYPELRLLKIIWDGNLAAFLYPKPGTLGGFEWETLIGVEKRKHQEGVIWHSFYSGGGGRHIVRSTPEMATILYGNEGTQHKSIEVWAFVIQLDYSYQ